GRARAWRQLRGLRVGRFRPRPRRTVRPREAGLIELQAVRGLPEIAPGDDLAALIAGRGRFVDGDILVVAQKVVSKLEGRLRDMREITPSRQAHELAARNGSDPRQVQAVLDESVRLVRTERVIISETRHGFICANAGVDHSNVPGGDIL